MFNVIHILASTAPAASGEMEGFGELMTSFGVNKHLFFSQLISFLIVAFVLKKFAVGPVQQMLEQRRARIAEGEEKLKRIEQQLADSEKRTQEAIDKANEQALRLINEAKESAAALSEKEAQKAAKEFEDTLMKAKAAAKAERLEMQADLKKEFGRLIAETTANVTGKVLTDADQKRINEEALASVEG
jgi:F-type H+-transporting ATPase subunit b